VRAELSGPGCKDPGPPASDREAGSAPTSRQRGGTDRIGRLWRLRWGWDGKVLRRRDLANLRVPRAPRVLFASRRCLRVHKLIVDAPVCCARQNTDVVTLRASVRAYHPLMDVAARLKLPALKLSGRTEGVRGGYVGRRG
jgi:hypothetical protein